jgi:hypothetical protein
MTQHSVPGSGLTFHLDNAGTKLLAVYDAGAAMGPIDKVQVGKLLASQGFAVLFIFADSLEK